MSAKLDIGALLDNSSIVITGGSGTLGRALTKEILKYNPRKLAILSRSESRQSEMKISYPENGGPIRYFIGDVRSESRLRQVFEGANIVIHAAALKRIEVCEREPEEAILTNVLGSLNAAKAARDCGVERFLLVSSDKACSAATLYGGTKYVAERLAIGMNSFRGSKNIRFSAVRYGNVLGSTGSVVKIFQEARDSISITDERMTRFWISPEDAARFVLSSLALMRGGETFIPKLPSMRIVDMAKALAPSAEIFVIGMRGAEKLHESMISGSEARWAVDLLDRYVLLPSLSFWSGSTWPEATPVSEDFEYSSGSNTVWMTPENLKEALDA